MLSTPGQLGPVLLPQVSKNDDRTLFLEIIGLQKEKRNKSIVTEKRKEITKEKIKTTTYVYETFLVKWCGKSIQIPTQQEISLSI